MPVAIPPPPKEHGDVKSAPPLALSAAAAPVVAVPAPQAKFPCILLTGLPASGKTTVGREVEKKIKELGAGWHIFSGADVVVKEKKSVWDTIKVVLDGLSKCLDSLLESHEKHHNIKGLLIDKNIKTIEEIYYIRALLYEKKVSLIRIVSLEVEDEEVLLRRLGGDVVGEKERLKFHRVMHAAVVVMAKSAGLYDRVNANDTIPNVTKALEQKLMELTTTPSGGKDSAGSGMNAGGVRRSGSAAEGGSGDGHSDRTSVAANLLKLPDSLDALQPLHNDCRGSRMVLSYATYHRVIQKLLECGVQPERPGSSSGGAAEALNLLNSKVERFSTFLMTDHEKLEAFRQRYGVRRLASGHRFLLFHWDGQLFLIPNSLRAVFSIPTTCWMNTPIPFIPTFVLEGDVVRLVGQQKELFLAFEVLYWAETVPNTAATGGLPPVPAKPTSPPPTLGKGAEAAKGETKTEGGQAAGAQSSSTPAAPAAAAGTVVTPNSSRSSGGGGTWNTSNNTVNRQDTTPPRNTVLTMPWRERQLLLERYFLPEKLLYWPQGLEMVVVHQRTEPLSEALTLLDNEFYAVDGLRLQPLLPISGDRAYDWFQPSSIAFHFRVGALCAPPPVLSPTTAPLVDMSASVSPSHPGQGSTVSPRSRSNGPLPLLSSAELRSSSTDGINLSTPQWPGRELLAASHILSPALSPSASSTPRAGVRTYAVEVYNKLEKRYEQFRDATVDVRHLNVLEGCIVLCIMKDDTTQKKWVIRQLRMDLTRPDFKHDVEDILKNKLIQRVKFVPWLLSVGARDPNAPVSPPAIALPAQRSGSFHKSKGNNKENHQRHPQGSQSTASTQNGQRNKNQKDDGAPSTSRRESQVSTKGGSGVTHPNSGSCEVSQHHLDPSRTEGGGAISPHPTDAYSSHQVSELVSANASSSKMNSHGGKKNQNSKKNKNHLIMVSTEVSSDTPLVPTKVSGADLVDDKEKAIELLARMIPSVRITRDGSISTLSSARTGNEKNGRGAAPQPHPLLKALQQGDKAKGGAVSSVLGSPNMEVPQDSGTQEEGEGEGKEKRSKARRRRKRKQGTNTPTSDHSSDAKDGSQTLKPEHVDHEEAGSLENRTGAENSPEKERRDTRGHPRASSAMNSSQDENFQRSIPPTLPSECPECKLPKSPHELRYERRSKKTFCYDCWYRKGRAICCHCQKFAAGQKAPGMGKEKEEDFWCHRCMTKEAAERVELRKEHSLRQQQHPESEHSTGEPRAAMDSSASTEHTTQERVNQGPGDHPRPDTLKSSLMPVSPSTSSTFPSLSMEPNKSEPKTEPSTSTSVELAGRTAGDPHVGASTSSATEEGARSGGGGEGREEVVREIPTAESMEAGEKVSQDRSTIISSHPSDTPETSEALPKKGNVMCSTQ